MPGGEVASMLLVVLQLETMVNEETEGEIIHWWKW